MVEVKEGVSPTTFQQKQIEQLQQQANLSPIVDKGNTSTNQGSKDWASLLLERATQQCA